MNEHASGRGVPGGVDRDPPASAAPVTASPPGARRVGVLWDHELADAGGLWPEQLGLDTCGECDVDETAR